MPLNIDGAGRSRTLACLRYCSTARCWLVFSTLTCRDFQGPPGSSRGLRGLQGASTKVGPGPKGCTYQGFGSLCWHCCVLALVQWASRNPGAWPSGVARASQTFQVFRDPPSDPRPLSTNCRNFPSFCTQHQKVAGPPPNLFQPLRTFNVHK